jgi:phosphate transport system permease protein
MSKPSGDLSAPLDERPASAGVPSPLFAATEATRRKLRSQRIAKWVFGSMGVAIMAPLVTILVYIFIKALPVLSWGFITRLPEAGMRSGGIWPALIGTVYLVVFSLLVAAPIGVMAGIYLNEFARDNWFTRIVNLAVVNLAGVPSIVHALFGVGAFVLLVHYVFGQDGKSILAASLTLSVMTLPVIIVSTKEALAAVPMAFREACWNLGASRWQVIRSIVLPNSISGILTGLILQVSRAAGDTAPIMFTGAVFYKGLSGWSLFPYRPTEQCMALAYHLYTVSTQVSDVPEALPYATAAVLIGFVFVFNSTAIVLRTRLRARKKW